MQENEVNFPVVFPGSQSVNLGSCIFYHLQLCWNVPEMYQVSWADLKGGGGRWSGHPQVIISKKNCLLLSLKILSEQTVQALMKFHIMPHFTWAFAVWHSSHLGVSSRQRVDVKSHFGFFTLHAGYFFMHFYCLFFLFHVL